MVGSDSVGDTYHYKIVSLTYRATTLTVPQQGRQPRGVCDDLKKEVSLLNEHYRSIFN